MRWIALGNLLEGALAEADSTPVAVQTHGHALRVGRAGHVLRPSALREGVNFEKRRLRADSA